MYISQEECEEPSAVAKLSTLSLELPHTEQEPGIAAGPLTRDAPEVRVGFKCTGVEVLRGRVERVFSEPRRRWGSVALVGIATPPWSATLDPVFRDLGWSTEALCLYWRSRFSWYNWEGRLRGRVEEQ